MMKSTRIGLRYFASVIAACAVLAHSPSGWARDARLRWEPNSESDLRAYRVYFGLETRGCEIDPYDSPFSYGGAPALQGRSPIFISLDDLEDATAPEYRLLDLPDDTPIFFAVTALNNTGAESLYSNEGSINADQGPDLCDANAPTNASVRVTFNEFVQEASATNAGNYTLTDESNASVAITGVTYDSVTFRHVTLQTEALTEGERYVLTVENVEDFFDGNPIDAPGAQAEFVYTNAPVIRGVRVLEPETVGSRPRVDVEFSERVDSVSAANASNYDIDNGSAVTLAQISFTQNSSDHRRNVILTLSELVEGDTYMLSVDGVTDTAGNPVAAGTEASFIMPVDGTAPQVLSVHLTNPLQNREEVKVVFDEVVDDVTAENPDNYAVLPDVQIGGVTLFGDGRTVFLDTAAHADGDYEMMVDGVLDRGDTPNQMATDFVDYTVVDSVTDGDGDGKVDSTDNCTEVSNEDQLDTDGDGIGNLCDGDLNNDGATNTLDLQIYRGVHRSSLGDGRYIPEADFNGDDQINTLDLSIYRRLHRLPPGPSCCSTLPGAAQASLAASPAVAAAANRAAAPVDSPAVATGGASPAERPAGLRLAR